VLLAVLVFRSTAEPVHGGGERIDPRPATKRQNDPVTSGTPKQNPEASPVEEETDNNRIKPIPGTERWHYEEFLRRAAADPDGFDRLADEIASSEAPLQERVALLRAAWKVRGPEAMRWFSSAFGAEAGTQDKAADALRAFVVRHLASHARAVPEARNFLKEKVFLNETVSARDRSAAGCVVLQTADPGELPALLETIRGITDAAVAEGALVGLGSNDHADAASALTWLSSNHPQKRVRERAAEVSRQRLTGDVGKEEED